MAKKPRKRLVIDASVARSSGGPGSIHPTARNCRDFLLGVLEICHRLVLTPAIGCEWKKHCSRFARTWRVSMEARKKVERPPVPSDENLMARIREAASSQKAWEIMSKDTYLLEAALATDSIVVSGDDEAREEFAKAATLVKDIQQIVWVNPSEESDCREWLRNGAEPEKERLLGRFAD